MTNQSLLWPTSNGEDKPQQEIPVIPPAKDGSPPAEWLGGVHPDGLLKVTSGFYLYAAKLNRVLTYLAHERREQGSIYDQLMKATGMSRTQVEAYTQYGGYMEVLVPRSLKVTPLGHLILQGDPFFDRVGTLWLLHYLIASNPFLLVWNYMCNAVLQAAVEISKEEAADQFLPFIGRWSESSIRKNVKKELRAFFADYTTAIFAPLDYLNETRQNVFAINRDVTPVPPLIFLASLLIYRDRHQPGSSGLEIPTLTYADHSPGRIMRHGEPYIRQILDKLHETGYLTIESKANLDQVRFRTGFTWLDAVRAFYAEEKVNNDR